MYDSFFYWLDSVLGLFQRLRDYLSSVMDEMFDFKFAPLDGPYLNYYDKPNVFDANNKAAAAKAINIYIKELTKYAYLKCICNNPPYEKVKYQQKMTALRTLEKQYPDLAKWYSPSKSTKFNESFAAVAFENWEEIKKTLDLLKKEEDGYE